MPMYIEVYNVKGGTGKSNTSKTLAGGFSTGLLTNNGKRYKTGIIDKDPLGSSINFYNIALSIESQAIERELSLTPEERLKEWKSRESEWKAWSKKHNLPYYIEDFSEEVVTDPAKRVPFTVFRLEDKPEDFDDYDVIIVDHPPRYTRDFYEDSLILMPTRLESESFIPTYEDYSDLVKKRHTVIVPNCFNDSVKDQNTIFNKYFKYEDEGTDNCEKAKFDPAFPTRGYIKERACYQNAYLYGDTIFGKKNYQYLYLARREFMSVYSDIKFETHLAQKR